MGEKIGVAGLGNMGGGIARRLLSKGYDVVGFDVAPAMLESFRAAGGTTVDTAAKLASDVPVIICSLPDPPAVLGLFDGPTGLLAGAKPGLVIVETSTIDPLTIADVAKRCAEKNVELVDATLSGQPPQAAAGELTLMVGTSDETLARLQPMLADISKQVHHTGGIGTAKTVKLVNNLMSLGNIAVASEAFSLGQRCGMDPHKLFDILSTSGGRSAHFNHDFPKVIDGDFSPGFKTRLALKDIRLIIDLAAKEAYRVELAPVIERLYATTVDSGYGDDHFAAVIKVYESWAAEHAGAAGTAR